MTDVEQHPEVQQEQNVIFKDLNADDEDQAPMEIESYCMNCGENVSISFFLNNIITIITL